jgi:hypothetical protein
MQFTRVLEPVGLQMPIDFNVTGQSESLVDNILVTVHLSAIFLFDM